MRSISQILVWLLRAWPVLSLLPIAIGHIAAHSLFPRDPILVNKITGTVLQIVGGFVVLHSVNANLGLFRDQHLGNIISSWFRSCPLLGTSVTLIISDIAQAQALGANVRISTRRSVHTVEERIEELEKQLEEFRASIQEDLFAANTRITQVHSELSSAVASNSTTLSQLSARVENATIGGFKQQAFGVLLAVYGAITSAFA